MQNAAFSYAYEFVRLQKIKITQWEHMIWSSVI